MNKTIPSQIKIRRDTASNWTTNNPVLALGEIGYDTTNLKLKIGDGTTAWSNLDPLGTQIITAANITVATADWSADATYADFGYKATISVSGITTSYSAQVNFSPTEVISGIFAPFTSTGAGVVYVWASEVPSSAISVDIIATKVVS